VPNDWTVGGPVSRLTIELRGGKLTITAPVRYSKRAV
jgi:hypothetical protein